MPEPQQQRPSEVQIILDDALTDLEALVDHYLPTSKDGGFAGRMMAAIEQAGASATKSIGGVVNPAAASARSASGGRNRRQPQGRPRSNTSRSQYSESSVEVSYDERTDDSEYDTNDTYSSGGSASEELKPVTAVVVRSKDKSKPKSKSPKGKDELMDQTIDTAVNTTVTTVDALDTSYFAQMEEEEEEEEPATILTAAKSNKHVDDEDTIDGPLPESPRRKAEREADEAADRLATRSYYSRMSSFELLDGSSNKKVAAETNTSTTLASSEAPRNEPTNGKTIAEKTHSLVQQYRQERKQQMADAERGITPAADEFATDAGGVERRREERRAEERRRLAAVAEHRRRLAYNAQKQREAKVDDAENNAKAIGGGKFETPPPPLNASDNNSESTTDSLADDLQSMVVTDLD